MFYKIIYWNFLENAFEAHEPLLTPLPSVIEEDTAELNDSDSHFKQEDVVKPSGSTSSTGIESEGGNTSEALGPTPPVISMVSKHSNGEFCRDEIFFYL